VARPFFGFVVRTIEPFLMAEVVSKNAAALLTLRQQISLHVLIKIETPFSA
jgi:hypothetical protein